MKTIFRYTADILLFLVVNKRFNFSLKIRINFNTKLWLTTRCLLDIGIKKWTKFVVALLDDTFTLVESSHREINIPFFVTDFRCKSRDTEGHIHLRNLKTDGFTLLCRENNLSVTIVGNLDIINNLVKLDHHGISYGVS